MNTTTCPGGGALKPSQRLLDAGLNYYTCSVCGAPCDEHRSSTGLYTSDTPKQEETTMNSITLNDKTYNLSDDLANRIKAEIEAQESKPKRWRADKYGQYYSSTGDGNCSPSIDMSDGFDKNRYATGNYFQTKAEAKAYRDRLLAEQVIRDSSDFVPDWSDADQRKNWVYYDHLSKHLETDWTYLVQAQVLAYYRTKEDALTAIQDPVIRKAYLTVFGVEDAK